MKILLTKPAFNREMERAAVNALRNERFVFGESVYRFEEEFATYCDADYAVSTSSGTHYRICKEALKAGKNVLLEKPMALKAKHAWELVGLAKSRDLCLQVGQIFRFNNALKLVRDLLTQHYLGQIYYAGLQWTFMQSLLNRDIISVRD